MWFAFIFDCITGWHKHWAQCKSTSLVWKFAETQGGGKCVNQLFDLLVLQIWRWCWVWLWKCCADLKAFITLSINVLSSFVPNLKFSPICDKKDTELLFYNNQKFWKLSPSVSQIKEIVMFINLATQLSTTFFIWLNVRPQNILSTKVVFTLDSKQIQSITFSSTVPYITTFYMRPVSLVPWDDFSCDVELFK